MISRSLICAVALTALSAPALAFHCPADVKAIDAALTKVTLTAKQREEVTLLRNEGEALHNAGNHAKSVSVLSEAMRIILNNL